MRRIALSGPPYSGKTSIAECLFWEHEYFLINFTDVLKRKAVKSLAAIGIQTSVETIKRKKDFYRAYLQGLGDVTGFSYFPERFIDEAVETSLWSQYMDYPVVVDNVRSDAQARIWVDKYDFVVVRLTISEMEQMKRAAEQGVAYEDVVSQTKHSIEHGVSDTFVSVELDVTGKSVSEICQTLVDFQAISRVREVTH